MVSKTITVDSAIAVGYAWRHARGMPGRSHYTYRRYCRRYLTSGNTAIATVDSATGVVTGIAPGAAIITYAVTGTCGTANDTATINVNAIPTVNATPNQAVCNTMMTTAIIFTGTPDSTTYTFTNSNPGIGTVVSGMDSIPSFAGANGTSAPIIDTVTVTPMANGCTGTASTFTIAVNPTPTVANPGNSTVCNGATEGPINFMGTVDSTTLPGRMIIPASVLQAAAQAISILLQQ